MDDINNAIKGNYENKLMKKIYSTTLSFISIFILIVCILINYYINNPTGEVKYNMISLSELMQLCINPCDYDTDTNFPCQINSYLNTYCGDKSLEDLEFLQYSMFILKGAYLLCSTYNDTIINKLGSGVFSLSSNMNTPNSSSPITQFFLFLLLYLIVFYLSQNVKSGIVNHYFNKYLKNIEIFNSAFIQSIISIFILVFTLLLFLNVVSYVSYLFWGALSSTTNNLMYIIMLIIIPFVFWIADVNISFTEGFREGAKNKKSKSKSKSKSSKNSKCVKVDNYNYIVPLFLVFIIPVIVTLKTFFTLIFTGLYGIPSMLLASDATDIRARIGKIMGYSFIALIFGAGMVIVEKIYDLVTK